MELFAIIPLICLVIRINLISASEVEVIPEIVSLDFDDLNHHNRHFAHHRAIRPILFHGEHRHEIPSTRQSNGHHADSVTIQFENPDGSSVTIDLQLAVDLLPENHFLSYQSLGQNGSPVLVKNFNRSTVEHCHYSGTIRGRPESRAALSTCHGLCGMLFDGQEVYYIETGQSSSSSDSAYFLYRHFDRIGADRTYYEDEIDEPLNTVDYFQRLKRSISDAIPVHNPPNSKRINSSSSYVELVLIVDHTMFKYLNSTLQNVHDYCKTLANLVNALFAPLNVFVALAGIVVWSEQDEFVITADSKETLRALGRYRRDKLLLQHPNCDNAQLLTRRKFGKALGRSFTGAMCSTTGSVGIVSDQSPTDRGRVAATIAHEMAHNLGMDHDHAGCKCSGCIMSAATEKKKLRWSSCNVDQLKRALDRGIGRCLKNKPVPLITTITSCGNGFVEQGEQCDCGPTKICTNPCCNATTCQFRTNAKCATGPCCDLNTCTLRAAGSVCRSAEGECDLAEYCNGESEFCPENSVRRNTVECAGGKAYCYEGLCRSHDDQCRVIWGSTGRSSPTGCYRKNTNGARGGNCGYNKRTRQFVRCESDDMMCGLMHCQSSERLESGSLRGFKSMISRQFIIADTVVQQCDTVNGVSERLGADPGLAPNGARCGEGKMCLRQQCVSILTLQKMQTKL